jgi:hypothetical protein
MNFAIRVGVIVLALVIALALPAAQWKFKKARRP